MALAAAPSALAALEVAFASPPSQGGGGERKQQGGAAAHDGTCLRRVVPLLIDLDRRVGVVEARSCDLLILKDEQLKQQLVARRTDLHGLHRQDHAGEAAV